MHFSASYQEHDLLTHGTPRIEIHRLPKGDRHVNQTVNEAGYADVIDPAKDNLQCIDDIPNSFQSNVSMM